LSDAATLSFGRVGLGDAVGEGPLWAGRDVEANVAADLERDEPVWRRPDCRQEKFRKLILIAKQYGMYIRHCVLFVVLSTFTEKTNANFFKQKNSIFKMTTLQKKFEQYLNLIFIAKCCHDNNLLH
jgi:hypothetical protein